MSDEKTLYWGSVQGQFENGLQLELRAKLALQMLMSPGGVNLTASDALDKAEQLIALAAERGYLKDLPEDDGLNASERRNIRRQVRAQVYAQGEGQAIAQEESRHVAPVPGELMGRLNKRQ